MKYVLIGMHLRREDIEPDAVALAAGPLFASGLEIADDQPPGERALLLRAAEARGRLLARATFVAVRYGVTVRSGEEAAEKCGSRLASWRERLERYRDDVEMTMKIAAVSPQPRPRREAFTGGAEYLRALHAASQAVTVDPAFRDAVEAAARAAGAQLRWVHRDNASLEVAFLLPRAGVEPLAAAALELRRDFPAVPFLLSGPWPLETFADADHE